MRDYLVRDHLKQKLKDPHFKEIWELELQKLAIVKPIIDYRIKHNLTQSQFAKKVGVSQQHISNIERGEFSSVETLEKILLYIGYRVQIQAIPLPAKTRNRIERAMHRANAHPLR